MSYAIIRNENYKMNTVPLVERHNERRNHNYSNEDIDLSRSGENYHLKQIQAATYQQEFERIRKRQELKGNLRLHGEKQSNVMCEFVITSDKLFFDRIGAERTKEFFEYAYNFVCAKVGGEQYIVSAIIHMDETTPHMHVTYIPTVLKKDRKGNLCNRINCSEFWEGRDSYSRLQDEYYEYITARGYDLERGVKGSTAEHLSTAEYKLKKSMEQIENIKNQLDDIDSIENIKSTSLPFGMANIKKTDLDKICAAAKGYSAAKSAEQENISLKEENTNLKKNNSDLREENFSLTNRLAQLKQDYDDFAEAVVDEENLLRENERLWRENERIGNQVHTLSADVERLEAEVDESRAVIESKDKEISMLKTNLQHIRELFAALELKFNKVMKFLEQHSLKEKWEQFIKPVVKHKSR